MRNITSCICILGLSGVAFGGILMDQIGPMDGSGMGAGISSSQDFEAVGNDAFDSVVADNFADVGGTNISLVEMILNGFNGFIDPSGVTVYHVNLYSGPAAGALSLVGDIDTQDVDAIDVSTDGAWLGVGFLQAIPTALTSAAGTQWVGVSPRANFGTSGQTGLNESIIGDLTPAFQANPNGGFAIPGNVQDTAEAAYRVTSGAPADPCDSPLGFCPEDINGSLEVEVGDLLAVIADFGMCGDGTFRPAGDIAPLPNGDCCVNVTDVLAIIAAFGNDCTILGGCCLADGTCSEATSVDCATAGGVYFGDNTTCADGTCVSGACCLSNIPDDCVDLTSIGCDAVAGSYKGDGTTCATTNCSDVTLGDECATPLPAVDGANPFDTTNMTASLPLPTCADDAAAFGWDGDRQDVWYEWTASLTNDYQIDTCDLASFDTSIVVYASDCVTQLACNGDVDNTACQIFSSQLILPTTAGTTYLIRVGGWGATDIGAGTLNINKAAPGACCSEAPNFICTEGMTQTACAAAGGTYFGQGTTCADGLCSPPLPGACCFPDQSCLDNLDSDQCIAFGGSFAGEATLCADGVCLAGAGDECTDAVEVFNGPNAFDTTLMTASLPIPADPDCAGTFLGWEANFTVPDMWLIYNSTFTGTVNFSACDAASYDTSMVLYAADCVTELACNGDSTVETGCQAFYSGIYDFPVVSGTSYVIRMGGWQGAFGAGTLTITKNDPNTTAACCAPDGTCTEITQLDCDALAGTWFLGALCVDVACYTGCPAGAVLEGCVCLVDGDDPETDCNGGANLVVPVYGVIALNTPICGDAANYVALGGGASRDTDWYKYAPMNAGGSFSMNVGSSGMDLLFGIVDLAAAGGPAFVEAFVLPGGSEATAVFAPLAAGDYAVFCAEANFDPAMTCASGLVDYFVELTSP